MKISKIINNSVVNTWDSEGREIIVMGRGVGFKAREDSSIDNEKVEKILHLDSQDTMDRFKGLLIDLPMEHVQISAEIISYAKRVLNRPISPNVYIAPTDHINFALGRFKQRMMFTNPLIKEVRSFYHEEYPTDGYAIAMIGRDLGIKLPMDEAASIVLHIVNVEYDTPVGDTMKTTNLTQQVSGVVEEYFDMEPDKQSLSCERFVAHLHFLTQRVFTGEHMDLDNLEFQKVIDGLYPEECVCGQRVQKLIERQYGRQVTEEEAACLAPHIRRIGTK